MPDYVNFFIALLELKLPIVPYLYFLLEETPQKKIYLSSDKKLKKNLRGITIFDFGIKASGAIS